MYDTFRKLRYKQCLFSYRLAAQTALSNHPRQVWLLEYTALDTSGLEVFLIWDRQALYPEVGRH